jgi:hypothetical protein
MGSLMLFVMLDDWSLDIGTTATSYIVTSHGVGAI